MKKLTKRVLMLREIYQNFRAGQLFGKSKAAKKFQEIAPS
jgi:hypothetical protein